MRNDRYSRGQVQSCKTCAHYEQPPCQISGLQIGDCKTRHADWYPQRGYKPCPYWTEKPLTDEDYK